MNAPNQQSTLHGTGQRVLVVEDDSDIRFSVATLLLDEG
jgi:hypothetical protein